MPPPTAAGSSAPASTPAGAPEARAASPSGSPSESKGASPRADRWIAASLAAGALVLYAATYQRAYWSDGRLILRWVEEGKWFHYHVLYLPLAHLARALARPWLGADPEPALAWLSAVCSAAAVGLAYAAARAAGARRAPAAAATCMFALAPSVWFYATCIEVHGPNLLAASAAALWLARRGAASGSARAAIAALVLVAFLFSTHLSGAFWAPALFAAATRGPGRRRPVLWGVAAAGVLGMVTGIAIASPVAREYVLRAVYGIGAWSPAVALRELVAPAGLLWIGLIALRRGSGDRPIGAAVGPGGPMGTGIALLVMLPFALVVPGLDVPERGAYALGLLPLLAVLAACALSTRAGRSGGAALALCAAGALGNAALAWRSRQEWVREYPGVEWIAPMIQASGNRGVVLAADEAVRRSIARHSRLDVPGLDQFRMPGVWTDAELAASAVQNVEDAVSKGRFAAATSEFAVTDVGRQVLERLAHRGARIEPASTGGYVAIRAASD